jgi:hypothetical protein
METGKDAEKGKADGGPSAIGPFLQQAVVNGRRIDS